MPGYRWNAIGRLGDAVAAEQPISGTVGRYRVYAHGVIIWSATTGACVIERNVWTFHTRLVLIFGGAEALVRSYGFPTSDDTPASVSPWDYVAFERALVYATSDGAYTIAGDFLNRWREEARAGRDLGFPAGNGPVDAPGCQSFQFGVLCRNTSAGRPSRISTPVFQYWSSLENGRSLLGWPASDETPGADGWSRAPFAGGAIRTRSRDFPLSVLFHNVALMGLDVSIPGIPLVLGPVFSTLVYEGSEREEALRTLIARIRAARPDIVGLAEMFRNDERRTIRDALRDLYPNFVEGPDNPASHREDGGLLLLSRYPISSSHRSIYGSAIGADALAQKGVLHARIRIPGYPVEYDVFLTHMQNDTESWTFPNFGPGDTADAKIATQLAHLNNMVQAHGSPLRPALVMGDFNTNALNPLKYGRLMTAISGAKDVWRIQESPLPPPPGNNGITLDSGWGTAFHSPDVAAADPSRGIGTRVDYFLALPGTAAWPGYRSMYPVKWRTSTSHPVSDHYGIALQQANIREFALEVSTPIRRVTISLEGFHCLTETRGTGVELTEILLSERFEANPDEVEFDFAVRTSGGLTFARRTERVNNVTRSTIHHFDRPITFDFADPGDSVSLSVTGYEVDTWVFGETGRATLGPQTLVLQRQELQGYIGREVTRVLPILQGDGGEYAVTVRIRVD